MIYRQEVCASGLPLTTLNTAWALKLCKSSALYSELTCERTWLLEYKYQSIDLWIICFGLEEWAKHRLLILLMLKRVREEKTLQSCDHVWTTSRMSHCQNTQTAWSSASFCKACAVPLYKLHTHSSPGIKRFYITPLSIDSMNKVEPPPCVTLQNVWVSFWLMCNWLDEWPSRSTNPSKSCLIKRHRRPWLKTSQISFI